MLKLQRTKHLRLVVEEEFVKKPYKTVARHRHRNLYLVLATCAVLFTVNRTEAQLFAPSVTDLVQRKGFAWKTDSSANFRFYFESGTSAEKHIDTLKERAEQSLNRILALLGSNAYAHIVTVFVVDSRLRMKALIGKELNGQAIPSRNAVLYVFSDTIDASESHELCHVFSKNLWGNTDDWINEGLAVYSDDEWERTPLHKVAKQLLKLNKLVPLEDVIKNFSKYPETDTYPECGSFVKFLYEKYGLIKVKQLWTERASAIPRIFGKNLSELEKEWRDFIKKPSNSVVTL